MGLGVEVKEEVEEGVRGWRSESKLASYWRWRKGGGVSLNWPHSGGGGGSEGVVE